MLDAREVKYTGEVEGIVNIEVNPEERLVLHGIERAVELLIVFVFQRRRSLGPQGFHIIYNIIFVGFHLLAVFPLGLFAKGNRYGKELTVFLQQSFDGVLFEEFLAVVVDIKDNVGTTAFFLGFLNGELRTSVAAPFYGLFTVLIALCDDFHLL